MPVNSSPKTDNFCDANLTFSVHTRPWTCVTSSRYVVCYTSNQLVKLQTTGAAYCLSDGLQCKNCYHARHCMWAGGSVRVATGCGLGGPAIESRWGAGIYHTCQDRPWGPPSFLCNGYRVSSGGRDGRGVELTAHPF